MYLSPPRLRCSEIPSAPSFHPTRSRDSALASGERAVAARLVSLVEAVGAGKGSQRGLRCCPPLLARAPGQHDEGAGAVEVKLCRCLGTVMLTGIAAGTETPAGACQPTPSPACGAAGPVLAIPGSTRGRTYAQKCRSQLKPAMWLGGFPPAGPPESGPISVLGGSCTRVSWCPVRRRSVPASPVL